jgi:ribosome-binding factor A
MEDETSIRQRRFAELIGEEMSLILQDAVEDPRLAGLTVTGAQVSRDLRQATVFVITDSPETARVALKALDRSQGYLRRQLAARAFLPMVPELHFRLDDSLQRAQRIESLLDEVARTAPPPDEPEPPQQ